MATVEYAKYHEKYVQNGNIDNLMAKESLTLRPDEYEDSIHYRKIFCPRCKVPLKRTPRYENKTSNDKDAFFSHYKSNVVCSWHTQKEQGKKYLNEEDTWHAIEDENLTVLTRWSEVYDEEEIDEGGFPVYKGVNEDPNADDITNKVLGRYRGADIPLPNRISSVRTLAINISSYKHKAIILPGKDQAIEVQSLLRALDDEEFNLDEEEYLFFGRVNSYVLGDQGKGPFDFLNIDNHKQKNKNLCPERNL